MDHKRELAEWCWQHQLPPPLYDREAVGPSTQGEDTSFMFCLANGVKDTGKGSSREEAQQQAAKKVLCKLQARAQGRKTSTMISRLHTRRISLEEPVSFLAKIAQDQSFQVSYNEFMDEGKGQFGCLANINTGPQGHPSTQMSLFPLGLEVGVCYGAGQDQVVAREEAARSALNYLRVITTN